MQHARMYNSSNPKLKHTNSDNELRSNTMSANQARLVVGSRSTMNIGATLTIGKKKKDNTIKESRNFTDPQLTRKESIQSSSIFDIHNNEIKDPAEPIQLTVWFHELRVSSEDIIIDSNVLPSSKVGDLYELESLEKSRKLIFIINDQNLKDNSEQSQKSKLQISLLSNPLQKLMDLPPRSLVQVKKVPDAKLVEADSIEIYTKDVNISRDSVWIFSSSLINTCGYTDKRLSFLNNTTGIIKYLYKDGKKVFSGYISENTKIVFRSESAKLTFLIQLSREMWHFEENGEIMFHKLVNNLFPNIFKRWRDKNTHHSITIVLFTSVDLTDIPWTSLGQGERPNNRRDYFRVVVDQVDIFHWDKIMANLRLEFANFKRDVMLKPVGNNYVMEGESLPSVKGNVLEAINLGITLVTDRFRNTDLKHSLNHFILVTPGTGLFDVDYNLMLETSKKMSSIDSALDIVCLSQPPLHIGPLFRYKVNGILSHCVPNWCDISFYKDSTTSSYQWIPRCKIYELQMMGVMENEVNDVQIERFQVLKDATSALEAMDNYDTDIFKPVNHETEDESLRNYGIKEIPKFKPSTPKDSNATLSLIRNFKTSLLPNSSAATIDISTTNSSVLGTVANTDTTALSSLYTLNKNTEEKPLSSSSDSIKSLTRVSTIKTIEKRVTPKVKKSDEKKKLEESRRNNHKKPSIETDLESPTNILWTEIKNPSKEGHSDLVKYRRFSRWNDVFPPSVKRRLVKWRSFRSPAALPIMATIFPSTKQLEMEYTFQIYTVLLNYENYLEIESTNDLMREMIQLRLLLGFQICYGDQVKKVESERKPGGNVDSLIKYFPKEICYGSRIYMTLNDEIHRIFCDYNGNLNVQLYRKTKAEKEKDITLGQKKHYSPLIRTRYVDDYSPAKINVLDCEPQKYNWNQFDQLLAGYEDALPEEKKEFHKMKFVVMPSEIPKNAYFISNENLTDEEIRVEGLRKLIAMIERGKYVKEKKIEKKEEILPEISFYTGNLYDFLNKQAENYDLTGNQPALMLPESMRFNKSIKLGQLAIELQDTITGLRLVDRTWHFNTHLHCFLGNELVSWLIECFEDIDNREEAASYGQSLMDKGLFKHVESRHGLLDGYYFYEFEDEYMDKNYKAEKSGWFSKKKTNDSLTNTRNNSDSESTKSPSLSVQDLPDSESSSITRTKKKFSLSRSVKYNVDPLKKSFRSEIVTVHYDRVHNPEHCYHIRLQWLNTTTKFIDETISNWSRLCERHGLKLVETPWKELCTIPNFNPFHSFVDLKLILNPWTDPEIMESNILKNNKFYYHLYLLKKSDFLLDNRSTVFFSKDNIEITYSWGKPIFQYVQFIHKTGYYIVELRDNGDFFLAPNNVHIIRLNAATIPENDSQKVMLNFRSACRNEHLLREIFREAKENWREEFSADILPTDI